MYDIFFHFKHSFSFTFYLSPFTLESCSYTYVNDSGGGEEDVVLVAKSGHASEIDRSKPTLVIGADTQDRTVDGHTEIGVLVLLVQFRSAVDIDTYTDPGIDIDVGMEEIGETDRGHDDNVVEILPLAHVEDLTRAVTRDVVPSHFADICHTAEREPIIEAVLVFRPYMLVMPVFLRRGPLPSRRHGRDGKSRVMPHQALEQLIAPTDTHLVAPSEMIPLGLCHTRQRECAAR